MVMHDDIRYICHPPAGDAEIDREQRLFPANEQTRVVATGRDESASPKYARAGKKTEDLATRNRNFVLEWTRFHSEVRRIVDLRFTDEDPAGDHAERWMDVQNRASPSKRIA